MSSSWMHPENGDSLGPFESSWLPFLGLEGIRGWPELARSIESIGRVKESRPSRASLYIQLLLLQEATSISTPQLNRGILFRLPQKTSFLQPASPKALVFLSQQQ